MDDLDFKKKPSRPSGRKKKRAVAKDAFAQASKRAREKRKKKDDAVLEENKALKRERADFVRMISELSETVESLRAEGNPNALLENELLRKQLKEHESFLNGMFDIAHGPESALPTDEHTKLDLLKQG